MKSRKPPLYLVEAGGSCSEFDPSMNAWREDLSLGYLSAYERGADNARSIGKELEGKIASRAGDRCRSIRTWSRIIRQVGGAR